MRILLALALAAAPAHAAARPAAATDPADPAAACGDTTQSELEAMPRDQAHAKLACFTRENARLFNAELPQKTDEFTTLERVSAEGTRFTYHNRLTLAAAEIPAGTFDLLEKELRAGVCADEDMRDMIALGGSYRYLWLDKAGVALDELVVDAC